MSRPFGWHCSLSYYIQSAGVSMGGVIHPCGSTMYMSYFRELSGSATSIVTTGMFVLGAGFGALSGLFHDGTLMAMTGTMLAAALLSNLVAWTIPAESLDDHRHRGDSRRIGAGH